MLSEGPGSLTVGTILITYYFQKDRQPQEVSHLYVCKHEEAKGEEGGEMRERQM